MNLLWWVATWLGYGTPATIAAAYLDDFIRVEPVGRFIEVEAVGRFVRVGPVGRFIQVTR